MADNGAIAMGIAVGIDLGTSNTVVACVRDGRAVTLADENGRRLIPSIVSFHPNGSVLVGESGQGAPAHRPGQHDLLGQAPHRPELGIRRGAAGARAVPVRAARGGEEQHARRGPRRDVRAARDERVRPAAREGDRGEGARRDGRPRRRHRPGELQRPAARVHQGGGQARRPRGAPHPERADRGRARVRADHEPERAPRRLRPRRRHVRHHAPRSLRATSSRSSPRPATRPSAATTSISSSPTSWPTRSSARTASIRAPT